MDGFHNPGFEGAQIGECLRTDNFSRCAIANTKHQFSATLICERNAIAQELCDIELLLCFFKLQVLIFVRGGKQLIEIFG